LSGLGGKEVNQTKELKEFWDKLKIKAVVKLNDLDELENLLSKLFMSISDLEKSRDKWKEKYFELKSRH
jgi:hypothetical protein